MVTNCDLKAGNLEAFRSARADTGGRGDHDLSAQRRGAGDGRGSDTSQAPRKYPTSTRQVLTALAEAREPLTRAALQEASALRDREHFVNEHLKPLLDAGLIEPTIPDKPRSSKQRYRLTRAGAEYLQKLAEKK